MILVVIFHFHLNLWVKSFTFYIMKELLIIFTCFIVLSKLWTFWRKNFYNFCDNTVLNLFSFDINLIHCKRFIVLPYSLEHEVFGVTHEFEHHSLNLVYLIIVFWKFCMIKYNFLKFLLMWLFLKRQPVKKYKKLHGRINYFQKFWCNFYTKF